VHEVSNFRGTKGQKSGQRRGLAKQKEGAAWRHAHVKEEKENAERQNQREKSETSVHKQKQTKLHIKQDVKKTSKKTSLTQDKVKKQIWGGDFWNQNSEGGRSTRGGGKGVWDLTRVESNEVDTGKF